MSVQVAETKIPTADEIKVGVWLNDLDGLWVRYPDLPGIYAVWHRDGTKAVKVLFPQWNDSKTSVKLHIRPYSADFVDEGTVFQYNALFQRINT